MKSVQRNAAVFVVFLTLEITLIILIIGNFTLGPALTSGIVKFGGYLGLVTALTAWYASAAGVANGMGLNLRLPVGGPLVR